VEFQFKQIANGNKNIVVFKLNKKRIHRSEQPVETCFLQLSKYKTMQCEKKIINGCKLK